MKLWVDDMRPAPRDYLWAMSVDQAKSAIRFYERNYSDSEILVDLDHDAGDFVDQGGDYIALLDWLEREGIVDTGYSFHIHTQNPVGRANMEAIIEHNGWRYIR